MTESEVKRVDIVSTTALESIERASIDMQISTAKRYPMHAPNMLSKVKEDMLTLATLDEETAEACFYALPRGGKTILGPSVRLAEIALNCYGNIRVGTRILDVQSGGAEPHVVIQSVCHDLENNALITIEKRRRITKKRNSNTVDEDDIQLAVNACTSIAYRDAAFKLIPMALIKPVWKAARELAVGNVKSLSEKRAAVIDRLKKMGASEDRILNVVNCRKVDDIGIDQLALLIGLGTALKDGETTLEDAFPPVPKPEDQKQGTDALVDKLKGKNGNGGSKPKPAPEKPQDAPESTSAADPADSTPKTQSQATEPENASDEGSTAHESKPGEIDDSERWFCRACDNVFAEPKGGKKKLCPLCLSDRIVDRKAGNDNR